MKKMRRILKKVGRMEGKDKTRSDRFIADMLSMTHGFSGHGKKFIGDISNNGGDIDQFSDDS